MRSRLVWTALAVLVLLFLVIAIGGGLGTVELVILGVAFIASLFFIWRTGRAS